MSSLLSGLYLSRSSAEYAVEELIKVGFERDEISLLMSDRTRRREFAKRNDGPSRDDPAAGSSSRVLDQVAARLVDVERLRASSHSLVGAGPIVSALTHFDEADADYDLSDALVGLGISEDEADALDDRIRDGRILVGVLFEEDGSRTSHVPRTEWNREGMEEVERIA